MILMNDFKAEPEALREAMLNATKRVLESGWYVLGKEVENFEHEWARICGINHAVGVANGMDAIEIALRALDVGPGDEVITTPMTAFATALAIIQAGATPVLADIEADTALLSIESVERCITRRTKAVVLVHLYGELRNIDAWTALCEERKLLLIEDCAQAHMASEHGKCAGTFGDAGAFSFYPTKNLGAPGDAGILVTRDSDISDKAIRLRNYGQSERYHHPEIGMNSRLDEIHAAMLSERLNWLKEFTKRRQEIALAYRSGIDNPSVSLLPAPDNALSHVYHLFVVRCSNRDALQKHLHESGIQSFIHYPIPVHFQKPCSDLSRDPQGLKNSEKHAEECLSIPCHPQMTDNDVNVVISQINGF